MRDLVDVHFFREFAIRRSILDRLRITTCQSVSFSLEANVFKEMGAVDRLRMQMNYYSTHLSDAAYRMKHLVTPFGPPPPFPKIPEMPSTTDLIQVSSRQLVASLKSIHSKSMTELGAKQQQYVVGDTWCYDATFKAKNSVMRVWRGGAMHSGMDLLSGKLVCVMREDDKMDYALIKDVLERSNALKSAEQRTVVNILYVDNEKQVGGQLRNKIPLLNVTGPSHLTSWKLPASVKVVVIRTWEEAETVAYSIVFGE